ncbi:hypothetical protein ABQJ54_03780 [Rhodanobacter sp. Si-c]|uniref:DUF2783 domain-containing protein n=1 Tax=Rhodanobacter lycopersici TaxID=3162487 RepID=A0ABV3QC25_9GAMM
MNAPTLHEGAALLRSMTGTEAALFAAMAGELALRHGDLAAGLVEALNRVAADRAEMAA